MKIKSAVIEVKLTVWKALCDFVGAVDGAYDGVYTHFAHPNTGAMLRPRVVGCDHVSVEIQGYAYDGHDVEDTIKLFRDADNARAERAVKAARGQAMLDAARASRAKRGR